MAKFDKDGNLVDLDLQDRIVDLIEHSPKEQLLDYDQDVTIHDLELVKQTESGLIRITSYTKSIMPTMKDIVDSTGKAAETITQEDIDEISEEVLLDTMELNHYDEIYADAEDFANEGSDELSAFGSNYKVEEPKRWSGYKIDEYDDLF